MEIASTAKVSEASAELAAQCRAVFAAVAGTHARTPQIQLVLTDDDYIGQLNAQYRGKDRPTDVLSFDLRPDAASKNTQLADIGGEIYISVQRAAAQAAEQGVSCEEEMARLLVHGLLHLAGFDHDTPETLRRMEAETDRILAAVGLLPSASSP